MMSKEEKAEMIALIQEAVNPRFDAIDQRFDAIDQRFDRVELRLTKVELKIEHEVDRAIKAIGEGYDGLFQKYHEEIPPLQSGLEELGHRVASVEFALQKKN